MNIYDFDEHGGGLTEYVIFRDSEFIYLVPKNKATKFKILASKSLRSYEADIVINRAKRTLTKSRFF